MAGVASVAAAPGTASNGEIDFGMATSGSVSWSGTGMSTGVAGGGSTGSPSKWVSPASDDSCNPAASVGSRGTPGSV